MLAKITAINGLLWLHQHNYIHGDIYNNNIFQLGSKYVIADFDKSFKSNNIKNKLNEISQFFGKLSKTFIEPFSDLIVRSPGNAKLYFKYEPSLTSVLNTCIRTSKSILRFAKEDEKSLQNITTCNALLNEIDSVMASNELMKQLYDMYVSALYQISTQYLAHGLMRKKPKRTRTKRVKRAKRTRTKKLA